MTVTFTDYRPPFEHDPSNIILDVTLPPGVDVARLEFYEDMVRIDTDGPRLVDAYVPGGTLPGGIGLGLSPTASEEREGIAHATGRAVIVAHTVAALHEAFEFVTVSGRRLVDPVALHDDPMYDLQTGAVVALLGSMIEAQSAAGTPPLTS